MKHRFLKRGLYMALCVCAFSWPDKAAAQNCDFTFTPQNPCPGQPVTLTVTNPAAGHLYTFTFSPSGPTPMQGNTVNVNFPFSTTSQTYTVTLLDSLGNQQVCSSMQSVTVSPAPDLSIALVPQAGVSFQNGIIATCNGIPPGGLEIKIRNTTPSGNAGQNVGYQINWGDGSPVDNYTNSTFNGGTPAAHTYVNQGSFPISITVLRQNGCSWTYHYEFYSGSNPAVGFGNPGSTINLCPPATINFPVSGTSGNSPGTEYLFQVNGTTVQTFTQANIPPTISYTFFESSCGQGNAQSPNAYFVKIIAINPCGSSEAQVGPITVSEAPVAVIGMTMPPNFCPGATVTFSNQSWGGAAVIQESPGVFSCDSTTEQVEWIISPGVNGVDFQYDPNDLYEQSITVQFLKTGTYTIKMNVLNENSTCGVSMATKTIVIAELPIANADAIIQGQDNCAPREIQFVNLSQNATASPAWGVTPAAGWHFEPGSTVNTNNPVVIFDQAGTYHVTLTISNPCGTDTWDTTIVVQSAPAATLSLGGINACAPYTLNLTAAQFNVTSTGGFAAGALTYLWTLHKPDNTTLTYTDPLPQNILFDQPGTYTLEVVVSNACGATQATASVTVGQHPTAGFSYTAPSDQCVTQTLNFTNTSTGTGLSVAWLPVQGPPGGASTMQIPGGVAVTFSQPGTYIIGVQANNNCPTPNSDIFRDTLVFFDSPQIDAFAVPSPCEGDAVSFLPASLNIQTGGLPCDCHYQVSGGLLDVTVPCGQATPAFVPAGGGPYTVTLTVMNSCGTASQTANLNFAQNPLAAFQAPAKICLPGNLVGADMSQPFTATPYRKWTLRDAGGAVVATSMLANPVFSPASTGQYTLELEIGNNCDTASLSQTVAVFASPTATLSVGAGEPCGAGAPALALNYTAGGAAVQIDWTFNGGMPATGSGASPVAPQYDQPGDYLLTVVVDNQQCPSATASASFTVAAIPTAAVSVAPRPKCLPAGGLTIPFNNSAQAGVNYLWSVTRADDGVNPPNPYQFTGGSSASSASPQIKINACGIYTYQMTAWNHCDTVYWQATDTFYTRPAAQMPQFPAPFCQTALLDLSATNYDTGCDPSVSPVWSAPFGQVVSTDWIPQNISFTSLSSAQTFRLYLQLTGVCGDFLDSVSIHIDAPEALVLGPSPLNLCKNDPPATLTANLSGGQWYLNGAPASAVVNPAALAVGQYTYVYRKGSGACISEDSLTVDILPVPQVSAGADVTVCVELGQVALSPVLPAGTTGSWQSSNPGVTFSGNTALFSTTLTATLTFTATDSLTGCAGSASIVLSVIPNTPLAVPAMLTLCNTPGPVPLPLIDNNPMLSYSGPGVTADGHHFDPSLPGTGPTNTLGWTNVNAAGCTAAGVLMLTLDELLAPGVLDAGAPESICQNEGIYVHEGQPQGQSGLVWLDLAGNQISPTGTLSLDPSVFQQDTFLKVVLGYLHNSLNCAQYDTLSLHIQYAAPDAGPDLSRCLNDPEFALTAANAPPPGFQAYWTPSDLISPAAGSQLAVLHFDNAECQFSDTVQIDVDPLPGSDFSLAAPFCIGQVIDFQNNTPGAASQSWYDNGALLSTVFEPAGLSLPGGNHAILLVSVTPAGCRDSLQLDIYVESPPTLVCTPDATQGCGPLPVEFSYTATAQDTLYFEVWQGNTLLFAQPASGSPQTLTLPEALSDQVYEVRLIAVNECSTTQSVSTITVKAPAVAGFSFNQDTLCNGQVLEVLSQSINSVADTIVFGALKVPTSVTQTESYTVVNSTENPYILTVYLIARNDCNTDTLSHDFVIYPAEYEAIAETHADLGKICSGDSVLLTGHATAGADTYWKNKHGAVLTTNPVWVVAEEGANEWAFFAVGCGYDSDTVKFTGQPAPPLGLDFLPDACPGVEQEINVSSSNAALYIVFAPGDTLFAPPFRIVRETPGHVPFTVWARSAVNGCLTRVDTALTVRPRPPVPVELVEGCTVEEGYALDIVNSPGAAVTVTNDSGYVQNSLDHLPTGYYRIHLVEPVYGCPNDTVVFVREVRQMTVNAYPETPDDIPLGESVDLLAEGLYIAALQWSREEWLDDPTSATPVALPTETGCFEFVVLATDDRNCEASDTAYVCVRNDKVKSAFPEAFSPNGDGHNDTLYPRSINPGVVRLEFRVYDKWNELLFESAESCLPNDPGPACGWDGNFHGEKAEMGNYYAVVTFWYLNGDHNTHHRLVRLIR
ncbi:MAG: PKD domain-containing protein [Saprospiraceae bacterium]